MAVDEVVGLHRFADYVLDPSMEMALRVRSDEEARCAAPRGRSSSEDSETIGQR